MPSSLPDTFVRLVTRHNQRTEAEIQADVRQFILDAPFELEDDDFHGRVRAGYLALAADAPESWLVVDGARDRKTIASTVWDRVKTLLG